MSLELYLKILMQFYAIRSMGGGLDLLRFDWAYITYLVHHQTMEDHLSSVQPH